MKLRLPSAVLLLGCVDAGSGSGRSIIFQASPIRGRRELSHGIEVAEHRPEPRRPLDCRRGQPGAAARILFRRDRRRPVEDHRRRLTLEAGHRRPDSTASAVGGVAVCEANPDVVYFGTGETELRGNIMPGDGVYKSTDAGKTWKHVGLTTAGNLAHPRPPDESATLSTSPASAILRTPNADAASSARATAARPGRKCSSSDPTGAVDLSIDPTNPNVLYAALLGSVAHAVEPEQRRPRQRPVQDHRRRRALDRNHAQSRPAHGHRSARSASAVSPARLQPRLRDHREPRTAASSAPTTPARPGSRTNDRPRPAPARVLLHAASTPTRRTRTRVYVLNVGFCRSTDGGKTFATIAAAARRQSRSLDRPQRQPADDRSQRRRRAMSASTAARPGPSEDYPTAQFYRVDHRPTTSRISSAARSRTTRRSACPARTGST